MIIKAIIGIVNEENEIVAVIKITSDNILIEGGAPRFLADRINHQIAITGNKFIIPFNNIRLRLWAVSYMVFAKAKRPDEANP
jgi:hypothetical protein